MDSHRDALSKHSSVRARLWATAALAVVATVQVWVISAGWMTHWPTYTSHYSLLADAFLHGQVSLRIAPDPRLLALADPYDPDLNAAMRFHDMSLYHGKYYMYWGPVPALVLAPFIHRSTRPIGDEKLCFAFILGIVLVSSELLLLIHRRLSPDAPSWTVAMGILVAGLATPIPCLLARAAVYEAAIVAGQFFLLAGIYFSFRAFTGQRANPIALVLAGASWALAAGSRPSLVVAIGALVLLVVWRLRDRSPGQSHNRFHPDWSRLAALGMPLAIGAVALGYYNYVRFGKWYEFGQRYQLAAFNLQQIQDHLFAWANLPPAVYSYFFRSLDVGLRFPFVKAIGGAWTYPEFMTLPPDYEAMEPTAGVLWCLPFVGLAAIQFIVWGRTVLGFRRRADGNSSHMDHQGGEIVWTACCLVAASLLGLFPVVFLIGATMRYLADLTPSLVVLAVMGLWQGIGAWPAARRRLLVGAIVLAAYSIVIGLLLGLNGYSRHFHFHHRGYLGL